MKKILIVGATYSDNFGDMLFTRMMADALHEKVQIKFYLLSDFAKEFVGEQKISNFPINDADALIYMPGGFFGDRHDTSLITTWYWFKRYFPIGIKFARMHKPILLLGVGAGPCKYRIMRCLIKYICKRATKIFVRESDSQEFFKSLDIKSDVTSDLAQLITTYDLPYVDIGATKKKRLLIHVNQAQHVASKILPAVRKFYEAHKEEYSLVVASDQVSPEDDDILRKVKDFAGEDVSFYKYGKPLELCNVIKQCDAVITYKLHMGIVACSYGKSVIAIPEHYKKVERYYKQIGYPERVLPFIHADENKIYQLLETYHDKPISIPNTIIDLAKQNYVELFKFIEELK